MQRPPSLPLSLPTHTIICHTVWYSCIHIYEAVILGNSMVAGLRCLSWCRCRHCHCRQLPDAIVARWQRRLWLLHCLPGIIVPWNSNKNKDAGQGQVRTRARGWERRTIVVWWLSSKASYLARVCTHVGVPASANLFGHRGYRRHINWIVLDTVYDHHRILNQYGEGSAWQLVDTI